MSSRATHPPIRLRGVRHNNLKNFDLDLPTRQLIVVTGLSGSGKSSLAFDTLFAEGQRRYIETFSPYARQFFDRMDKPQVDRIEGIPPAIAVEQRNNVRTTRSTVGTMTELCDYMKVLWPHLAELHCRQCDAVIGRESPQQIWKSVRRAEPAEVLVTFDLPLSGKLSLEESLNLVSRQGYQRLLWKNQPLRVDDALPELEASMPNQLTVIQDRVKPEPSRRTRFVEACEQAYHFGKGRLDLRFADARQAYGEPQRFSNRFHCARCDLDYREPTPALFSFNHPMGACAACRGFGRIITIDYDLALPDRTRTLAEGVVKPWQTGHGLESQADLMKFCRKRKVPTDVPFNKLPKRLQDWVIQGDPGYGKDDEHRWPRYWYGVTGYFRWLESKAYKMHVRVMLARYRAYVPCPDCRGQRFQPESLLFRARLGRGTAMTLADFYQLPVTDALDRITGWMSRFGERGHDPAALALKEVRSRLQYLVDVGLGYLTLDRPTRTLSGGETERVNLTTCLGSRLVNTLFVLDEPSVGLHPRDTQRLVQILEQLRDTGNTVVVVEHESSVMRAADQVVDLGPGQGEAGGELVFQGAFDALVEDSDSITARYLNGTQHAEVVAGRDVHRRTPRLKISGASRHNLKNLSLEIPLGRLVCLTGVSGSGKTTLARDILFPGLQGRLKAPGDADEDAEAAVEPAGDRLSEAPRPVKLEMPRGHDLSRVMLVDQSSLGRTPRSNPAVYVGAFDDLRELFAQTETARQRGLTASSFSFNSNLGQCERCRGAGFEKIEMQFLSDVQIRCPDCNGRRYRPHILEIRLPVALRGSGNGNGSGSKAGWSIAQLLESTVNEALNALVPYGELPAGERALQRLQCLADVGLGYLHLGQPVNTLSGGESQRLKLAAHLAEHETRSNRRRYQTRKRKQQPESAGHTFFIFDEPTTGLHFHDVHVLLKVFQRLVDAGHSLLVVEHNLDVIRSADWILDLGPEGGEQGGRLVVEGTCEAVSASAKSHTGEALRAAMGSTRRPRGRTTTRRPVKRTATC